MAATKRLQYPQRPLSTWIAATKAAASELALCALLPLLRERGIHVAIGGVALPNDASIALHEKLGFERVATFRQVGFKHDRWVDVAYLQLVLS